ncbi:hypothetical protein AVEN_267613-1 [Araneus ventricosus]|uniref:Uncharacterized protein n=1 Tax=Araneus ventricosus TaxID=182803 RepID=A0A4Y2PUW6_ARAVE|nr:hypothetical protein AVEN_267613-1 [Araneus ventricosus]
MEPKGFSNEMASFNKREAKFYYKIFKFFFSYQYQLHQTEETGSILKAKLMELRKVVHLAGRDVTVAIEPPESMQTEEYEEWMSIDEDIPVAATLTDLEICQAIKVHESDGD